MLAVSAVPTALAALAGPAVTLALGALLAVAVARGVFGRWDALVVGGPLCVAGGVAVAAGFGALAPDTAYALLVVLAFVASLGVLRALDRPRGAWTRALRRRFLFGVPWGTLVVLCLVTAVYLFLQNGVRGLYTPVTIPFTSWSYFYPLGVLTAPFSHGGFGHLTGNLVGTLVFAPIAEYAVGHYPRERGRATFQSLRTNPYARAFLLFPLAVVGVAELTSVLAWGPIIGFSGVVFAFLGFAITRYPLAAIVGIVAQTVASDVFTALRDPVAVASAGPSYGGPWWAGIAIQGHLTGLLIGFLLGALLAAHRDRRPSALSLWGAVVGAGFALPLWTVWWYRGPETYVLYRWLGVLLVLALAALAATAVRATDRALLPAVDLDLGLNRRQAAVLAVVLPLCVVAGVAVPVNLTSVAGDDPGGGVQVNDYRVTYAEDVPNQRVNVVPVSAFGETTQVNASGVIVSNPDREVWTQAVSRGNLAYWGERTVRVGGVGWTETIDVRRRGWVPAGGDPVYAVSLRAPDGDWTTAYRSASSTAEPVIRDTTVGVAAEASGFALKTVRNDTVTGSAAMPAANGTVTVDGLDFVRNGTRIVAVDNGTRVTVVEKETYQ
ncbi:rhomboid family intramembrane serine protease [Halocalculus aciditolerans]|uniref:Peptidase S54 rhomboid domain-containing protein n=1 Tax=Halocalculus aciditolerans TaxID=1383812 RepID=A0A830F2V2_9EURY|nr:rhomboid family intramembrane serine protease [Halocalculus aciditolerans]GGL57098.1 hypothetical protein GCM10009039_14090 [Halocalculus aciditolerans]